MGGCRCVYRSCQSSTSLSPGLHYFHFPVKDAQRCEQWIVNARKPEFRSLEKDKLRNKVVCSLHFEERCFTNEKHDRLVYNAVPTLGCEEEEVTEDPLKYNYPPPAEDTNNIMLIPIDADNTKFTLPDVGFTGMSYTIYDDDTIVPTSKLEELLPTQNPKPTRFENKIIKPVIKKIKTSMSIPPVTKKDPIVLKNFTKMIKNESGQQQIQLNKSMDSVTSNVRLEHKIKTERSNNNIQSFSLNSCNGDVSLEPTHQTHILPDVISEQFDDNVICDYPNSELDPVSGNFLENNVSIQLKSGNEYTMSMTPVSIVHKTVPTHKETGDKSENTVTNDNTYNSSLTDTELMNTEDTKEYLKLIKNNTKQILQLKKMVEKQCKVNKYILQRKRAPRMRQRRMSKVELLKAMKEYVKPSLLAILKLELLPGDEVVLNDNEEKFITDLYTENPDCYNLLRNKFNWNLPCSEKKDETNKSTVE
ncbi:uncharacterized protein CBL_14619 [Carabus blaptoides fortunei]